MLELSPSYNTSMLPQFKRHGSNPFHLPSEIHHESNELYMEQLRQDIDNGLISMQHIINNIGTNKDTIHERREFVMTQMEVNQKLIKATAANNKIELALDHKHNEEIQKQTDSLRRMVETAVKEFSKCMPNGALKNNNSNSNSISNEITPLLSNISSHSTNYDQYDAYEQIRNEMEIKDIPSIHSTDSMQHTVDALYGIIREQEIMINVQTDMQSVSNEETILTRRVQFQRERRHIIIGLLLCLLTLAIVVIYIYFRFIKFKK